MHTYTETETHTSLVRTFPDLTGWSLNNLLGQYADDAQRLFEATVRAERAQVEEIGADMARIHDEIERRSFDYNTHVCHLGGVGVDQLYALATALEVDLAAICSAISALPKDSDR